jgi:predicted nuclease with TOPRIM domain
MYAAREKLISISTQKVDVEEIREKLKAEVQEQSKQLQIMVNSLLTENMDLKNRMQQVERKLSDFEKHVSDLNKAVKELAES